MPKVPQLNLPKPPQRNTTIICWAPGATEADKQHDLAELEKYMEFRRARAAKRKAKK